MRFVILIVCLLAISCGGSLSDEQRKKLREQMELHEIKKITDAEITEAALQKGRYIFKIISSLQDDSVKIDSMLRAQNGKIRWIVPGASDALDVEQQLIEAYLAAAADDVQDNVQEIRTAEGKSDSLLYTKPVMITQADSIPRLKGVWNIWLSKKELILSMDKK